MAKADEPLMTAQQVGKLLGLDLKHETSLYNALARLKIPRRKLGARVRYVPSEVRAWVPRQEGD